MWKCNQFTIGDIVSHNESPTHEFQVADVMRGEVEEAGNYMYVCKLFSGLVEGLGKEYNYIEPDLFLIRKGSKEELQSLLQKAITDEHYEIASEIKKLLDE